MPLGPSQSAKTIDSRSMKISKNSLKKKTVSQTDELNAYTISDNAPEVNSSTVGAAGIWYSH